MRVEENEIREAGPQRAFLETVRKFIESAPLSRLPPQAIRQLSNDWPKIELHAHIEGSVSWQTVKEVAAREQLELRGTDPLTGEPIAVDASDEERLRSFAKVSAEDASLPDLLHKIDFTRQLFASPAAIESIAESMVDDAAEQNVKYLELRFSPHYLGTAHGVGLDAAIRAVDRGAQRAARKHGIEVNYIITLERHLPVETCAEVAERAFAHKDLNIVAFDLASDEGRFPPEAFAEIFQNVKKRGYRSVPHAGEGAGAQNIATCIRELGADRIGHGTDARLDADVLQLVKERDCFLEMSLTSEICTQTVESLDQHPFGQWLRDDVPVVLTADDPAALGASLSDEYAKAIEAFDLTVGDLRKLTDNTVRAAFVGEAGRRSLRASMEEGMTKAIERLVESLDPETLATLAHAGIDHSDLTSAERDRAKRLIARQLKALSV